VGTWRYVERPALSYCSSYACADTQPIFIPVAMFSPGRCRWTVAPGSADGRGSMTAGRWSRLLICSPIGVYGVAAAGRMRPSDRLQRRWWLSAVLRGSGQEVMHGWMQPRRMHVDPQSRLRSPPLHNPTRHKFEFTSRRSLNTALTQASPRTRDTSAVLQAHIVPRYHHPQPTPPPPPLPPPPRAPSTLYPRASAPTATRRRSSPADQAPTSAMGRAARLHRARQTFYCGSPSTC
jgi:hypothetical protein